MPPSVPPNGSPSTQIRNALSTPPLSMNETFIAIANACIGESDIRSATLQALSEHVDDLEEKVAQHPTLVPTYIAMILSCGDVSNPITGMELLDVCQPFTDSNVPTVLSSVACDHKIHEAIRLAAVTCMSGMSLPNSYLHHLHKDSSASNDMMASDVKQMYVKNVNDLVNVTISTNVIETVGRAGASLINNRNKGQSDVQAELGMKMMHHLLLLLLRMLCYSSENYAKLRLSLSKGSPVFVQVGVMPYFRILVATSVAERDAMCAKDRKHLSTALLLCVRALAVLTFKVKTVREVVCEEHEVQVKKLLLLLAAEKPHPELLAALFKLHVNVEGGHGDKWMRTHEKVSSVLCEELKKIFEEGNGCLYVFYRCVAQNVDGVPTNRTSRSYPRCRAAFEMGQMDFVDVADEEGGGGKKKRVRKKKNKKEAEGEAKGEATVSNSESKEQGEEQREEPSPTPVNNRRLLSAPRSNSGRSLGSSASGGSWESSPKLDSRHSSPLHTPRFTARSAMMSLVLPKKKIAEAKKNPKANAIPAFSPKNANSPRPAEAKEEVKHDDFKDDYMFAESKDSEDDEEEEEEDCAGKIDVDFSALQVRRR